MLRDAGVVDAGGYGLTVLLAGIVGALRGSEPPPLDHHEAARVTHPQHSSSTYRYCTNFAVTGTGLEPREFAVALEELGDSVLVVGDATTLKVHVHTDDPNAATAVFANAGTVSHLDVADMREQVREREARLSERARWRQQHRGGLPLAPAVCGAVAVATGAGMTRLFESLGVRVLDGGPTLNPSTYDLLAAIHAIDSEQVVVLPNSANVLMAAERAAELSDKTVAVVPSRSQQAGLAAAVSLDPARRAQANAAAMQGTLDRMRTGAVARAARDDAQGRFREGDAIGFVEEKLIAWGRPRETLRGVLEQLAENAELITCLRGAEAPLDDETVQALAAGEVEFELSDGGQPSYWWLLSAPSSDRRPRSSSERAGQPGSPRPAARRPSSSRRAGAHPRPSRLAAPLELQARRRQRRRRHSACTRSATCSSTCHATAARRARLQISFGASGPPSSSRSERSRSRSVRRRGMRPLVEATVADATGSMKVAFFNQPWLVSRYHRVRGSSCTASSRAATGSGCRATP